MPYETEWNVRLGDVDRAGVIYYPTLFDALHRGVEELFEAVGWPLHRTFENGTGFPVVNASADYLGRIRFGDAVRVEITPEVGDGSITFRGVGHVGDERVFEAAETHAVVERATFEPIAVPDELRAELSAFG